MDARVELKMLGHLREGELDPRGGYTVTVTRDDGYEPSADETRCALAGAMKTLQHPENRAALFKEHLALMRQHGEQIPESLLVLERSLSALATAKDR